jgi:phage terminase large subunit GpA-like protein
MSGTTSRSDPSDSHSETLVEQAWAAGLAPEPSLTVSEWSDDHRILSARVASEPGRWRTDRTPYLREPMDALSTSSAVQRIAFMKGAQIGATEAGNSWIGYVIHHAPGPMLAVSTVDMAKRNSKQRIAPLIEESLALKDLVKESRTRDSGNTILVKEFPGGILTLTGANSAVGLRSMPARYLFLDEVDAYPGDVDGEGDPVGIAEARTRTFKRRKIFIVSTPTVAGRSRIEREFLRSDQRRYFVPCPHCHSYQTLKFAQLQWPKGEPRKGRVLLRGLRRGHRREPQDRDAAPGPVAGDGQGRREDGRVPPVQPVQSGRVDELGRCRGTVARRPGRPGPAERVPQYRARRDLAGQRRCSRVGACLRPA